MTWFQETVVDWPGLRVTDRSKSTVPLVGLHRLAPATKVWELVPVLVKLTLSVTLWPTVTLLGDTFQLLMLALTAASLMVTVQLEDQAEVTEVLEAQRAIAWTW